MRVKDDLSPIGYFDCERQGLYVIGYDQVQRVTAQRSLQLGDVALPPVVLLVSFEQKLSRLIRFHERRPRRDLDAHEAHILNFWIAGTCGNNPVMPA